MGRSSSWPAWPARARNTACKRADVNGPRTLVIDLDSVARAMGRDVLIDRKVEQATQALNAKLIEAAQSMDRDLKKQQAELGPSATEEQRAKVKQTAQKIQE